MKSDEKERSIIYLEIEKSKINREKAKLVLNNSIMLYLLFMAIGVIGFVFEYLDSFMLNLMIIVGIVVLIIGTVPYLIMVSLEEKKINKKLMELRSK